MLLAFLEFLLGPMLREVNRIHERVGKCVGMTVVVVAALAMVVLVMWSGGGVVVRW